MKYLPPGTYNGVICRGCGAVGSVTVLPGGQRATETTVHASTCRFVHEQPEHLKRRSVSRRQEKRTSGIVGTRLTAASGALNHDADSRRTGGFRVENKTTASNAYVVRHAWWADFVQRALAVDEEPLLQVDFQRERGTLHYVMLRVETWVAMTGETELPELPPTGRLNFHLTPLDIPVGLVTMLDPETVVMTLERWDKLYPKDQR